MEERKCQDGKCPECQKRAEEAARSEELNLAVLVALVPVLAMSLFGNLGLF